MSLSTVFRSATAALAFCCLVLIGASAQDQATTAGSQSSQTKATHKTSKRSSSAAANSRGQVSAADKQFMMKAAEGGMDEVQLGQLATQNAKSDEVKQFGQRMVDDHTKANDQLKQLAEQKGVTLPTELSAKDKSEKEHLAKLQGEQFDRAYMQHMVQDHKKDVAEFKKESTSANDPQLKDWASQTLPTLESHLKQAEQVESAEMSPNHAKSSTTASTNPKQ
jgi:putative membrane protein